MAKKDKMDIKLKKCLTPTFRVSFPTVYKAKSYEGGEPKFSITMLFDKKTDLKELKRAVVNAANEEFGDKSKWPKKLKMPFRDGDEKENLQGYKGTTFVTATSKQKPGLVDAAKEPIIDESDFYAGCYARATLIAFYFNKAGNEGISFSLQNIQKLKDGEAFSGRKSPDEDFDAVTDSDTDESGADEEDTDLSEFGV